MKIRLLLLLCALAHPAGLVLSAEYSVTPIIMEHTVAPRDILEESIKITNTSGGPLRLFPTVNAVTVGDGGAIETFVPASMGNTATSATSWIEITRNRVEIAPNESIKIPIKIHVSPNALPGEYHVFVGFPGGSNRDIAEASVLAGTAPGTIVRLSLAEKKNEYLRLQRFSIPRFVTSVDKGIVSYDIENVGSSPLVPTGEIILYNGKGIEQTSIPVNPESVEIRPQSTEHFTAPLGDTGYIGRHKAYINIEYGTNVRANVYDTTYFTVVPLRMIVALFVALLFVSILLTLVYHRRSRGSFVYEDDESVSVYVRTGQSGPEKDHDINLKN